jgi:hypothetical protein
MLYFPLKRGILLLLLGLALPSAAKACDFCNLSLNLMPQQRMHRIGLSYRYSGYTAYTNLPGPGAASRPASFFKTAHNPNSPDAGRSQYSRQDYEYYHRLALRGRFFLSKRWQLRVHVPLLYTQHRYNGRRHAQLSAGDPLAQVTFFPLWDEGARFAHRLGLGGGLQMPLGQFARQAPAANSDRFAGTGAWSLLAAGRYMLRWQNWGLQARGNYRISTRSPVGYRHANALNWQLQAFRHCSLGSDSVTTKVLPAIGTYYEESAGQYMRGDWIDGTGGRVLFATAGATLFRGPLQLAIELQYPLYQERFGTQLANGGRMIAQVSWAIGG